MKKKNIKILLFIWIILICVLTLFPMHTQKGSIETYYDKVAHFFLFGIFSFLFFTAFKESIYKRKIFFLSIFAGVLFSLSVEFLQKYIPGRNMSELDFIAGAMGAMFFSYGSLCFFKKN